MKILVVDDDGPSRYLLKAILEPQGYEVFSASNGIEAINILKEEQVDLIISDLMMPKMDGFQLLRTCKTEPSLKNIPFIIYTANYTKDEDLTLARDIGADLVIVKPIEPEEFLNTLSSVIPEMPKTAAAEPAIPAHEKETYLEKYSSRVVAKLDEKVAELQNLNRLLRALRRINQMMIRTKDLVSLFEHACNILVKEAGYNGAWIIHIDQEGNVDIARNAGFNETFPDLLSYMSEGKKPPCMQRLSGNKGEIIVIGPGDHDPDCPVGCQCSDMVCMVAGMYAKGKPAGLIIVFLEPGQEANEDEISLFTEIADDVSFAINTITIDRERKEVEKARRQSEEKYYQLFNNASDSIFLHELMDEGIPGKFLEINDAACSRLGYTREELLDMSVSDINTKDDKKKAPGIIKKIREDGHIIFERYHKCKDGTVFPVEVSAHTYPMDGRQVILSICRDITERKEMENQISAAIWQIGKNMGQLATLNDEIRNPLTLIIAYSENVPEEIRKKIHGQAYEIDNIIKLLDNEWLKSEKIWNFLHKYYGIRQQEDKLARDEPESENISQDNS
ncbi:MAG: response regulator [Methanomicrobiaceae archaeon]|nr:response regulator [Methanomicrobiaceae archaeon]